MRWDEECAKENKMATHLIELAGEISVYGSTGGGGGTIIQDFLYLFFVRVFCRFRRRHTHRHSVLREEG